MSVWQHYFQTKITKAIDAAVDGIIDGSAKDYAEYASRCAYLAGLRLALEISDTVDRDIVEGR